MTNSIPAHDAMVRFVNVQKSYDGESLVVKNLNLDIAKGEFLTMLGPSGSGKTTTLMMHASPAIALYTMRWFPSAAWTAEAAGVASCC
jgi:putative spermidine/putrescine transport system ATP-binding protein